jgi:outer membrane receptor protein involved in Fe transport
LGQGVELRLGADWRRTTGRTKELYSFVNGAATRNRVAGGESQTYGGFAEASFETGPLTITGAARLDRWQIENGILHERVLATGAVLTDASYPDRSGWEPTGRAGIAWHPAGAVTLRSAAYLGWRLPTLNELYRPFRVGADATAANAFLDPERLKGVEVGADYRFLSTARVGVTLFANRLRDAIANVTLGGGPGVFPGVGFVAAGGKYSQRQNLDAIDAWGVELDGGVTIGRFSLTASYAHVRAKVKASGPARALDGRRPAQTPHDSASATLGWQSVAGARASLSAHFVGAQSEDDLGSQILPDATTFDAAVTMPLKGRLSIEARAENITDARVVAGISGAGIVERATPRTFWLGLRLGG